MVSKVRSFLSFFCFGHFHLQLIRTSRFIRRVFIVFGYVKTPLFSSNPLSVGPSPCYPNSRNGAAVRPQRRMDFHSGGRLRSHFDARGRGTNSPSDSKGGGLGAFGLFGGRISSPHDALRCRWALEQAASPLGRCAHRGHQRAHSNGRHICEWRISTFLLG